MTTHPRSRSFLCVLVTAVFAFAAPAVLAQPAENADPTATEAAAAATYQEQCASCHGSRGQGTPDSYDKPLAGKLSLADLVELIERTMPEGEPETCVGDDARRVAAYVYREFYLPSAGESAAVSTAPRVELARLTVTQHQNAIADVIGHFTPPQEGDGRGRNDANRPSDDQEDAVAAAVQQGLRGEYYQSKGMSKADARRLERVDRRLEFDFGSGSPAEDITADQFAIVWQGSLLAHDTGYYEFRIRTQNGARLYLNSDEPERRRKLRDDSSVAGQAALVDAWVSSGEMREHTARVFLLGGRAYPVRLEFFKYLEETASLTLEWKPPHGVWSVLDHRHLSTARVPRIYVVETPFPADDRSLGYERGSSVSPAWQEAVTSAAIGAAAEVVNRLPLLAGLDDESPNDEAKLKEFAERFASVAFRRPLTSAERTLFGDVLFRDASHPEAAVRRAVLLTLTSPSFLYLDLTPPDEPPSQDAVAARLAFALWDSIPDQDLADAAREGRLGSPEDVEAQARRLLDDPRAHAKVWGFFAHWLELEERDLAKDGELFPEFDEAVVADLRESLRLFVERVVWSESSDYRELLLADYMLLNPRLKRLYGPPVDHQEVADDVAGATEEIGSGEEFESFVVAASQRAGVLTHPYLLSAFAYHNNTSPIHRGVFLTRNIVGRVLKPPPVAVAFKNDEFAADLTMREKVTQLTRDNACMACHQVINPLGFALENYDAIGRWRTSDNAKPVDSQSKYVTIVGDTIDLRGARDIAEFAVTSESARLAFVVQVFHHLVKYDPSAFGPDVAERLRAQFVADDFSIRKLMARIAVLAARRAAPASQPLPATASTALLNTRTSHAKTSPHSPPVSP